MEYQRFDPTSCGFPKPKVPILAPLSRQSLGQGRSGLFRPLGLNTNARFFTRGRYALTEAYRLSGVGENGALLAPAYHCRTMLDPAIRLGAKIMFYALKPDLSPDLPALAATLATRQQPVKALLVTHYFGFAQTLEPLADFCAEHAITLIEDCSHALFTRSETNTSKIKGAMGQTGRFCVASPYKFFPCEDGGLLWRNDDAVLPEDTRKSTPTLAQEAKGVLRSLMSDHNQNQPLEVNAVDNEIQTVTNTLTVPGCDVRKQDIHTSEYYDVSEEHLESLRWSRWIMRHTNLVRLAARRRENYQRWGNTVAHLPHCAALFPRLPVDCVPYMFPLTLEHPELHFFALKQLGIPMWRWDDMAVSGCHIASDYRLKMVHLPCHQELTEKQMAWMTTVVNKAMLTLSPGNK